MWILRVLNALCAALLSMYGLNSLLLTVLYLWHRHDPAARGMETAPTSESSRAFHSAQGVAAGGR